MSNQTWGGRFQSSPDEVALRFSQSVDVDQRLWDADIRGSVAHANMLGRTGIISDEDAKKIVEGLTAIRSEIEAGEFSWDPAKEDVHMNIEARLIELVGDAGKRLHTARSRNDQVATDMRLWTRDALTEVAVSVDRFNEVLATQARAHLGVLMPGYTHLQRAQPVRLSHHLLAWCAMLDRDRERALDARKRVNISPLGAGALASTTFPIDREQTAKALGFDGVLENSLDAVGDRDFLLEALGCLTNLSIHLSRIAEELVLWSSQEFAFIQMSDAFTTGSSMMPQKKNPDMAELVRGKTGRVVGSFINLAVVLKGLPLAYNRDLQEDKAPVFDAFDTVLDCLNVLTGALKDATFQKENMRGALKEGFVEATEIADFLAERGVPFREAHHVSGRLVGTCIERGITLSDLSLADFKNENEAFDDGIFQALDPETAVERRNTLGGPARAQVALQIDRVLKAIGSRK